MESKGFTIIEVLVVVAIISIFAIITISNFPVANLQFSLTRSAYDFQQDLRRAQDMAMSSIEYKDSNGVAQNIDGYGVHVDLEILGNKKYLIYADKSPGNQIYDIDDYVINIVDLDISEPGITIKQINNTLSNSVSFNLNSSDFVTTISQLAPNKSKAEFIFAIEKDWAKTKTVSVNIAGLVEVK